MIQRYVKQLEKALDTKERAKICHRNYISARDKLSKMQSKIKAMQIAGNKKYYYDSAIARKTQLEFEVEKYKAEHIKLSMQCSLEKKQANDYRIQITTVDDISERINRLKEILRHQREGSTKFIETEKEIAKLKKRKKELIKKFKYANIDLEIEQLKKDMDEMLKNYYETFDV